MRSDRPDRPPPTPTVAEATTFFRAWSREIELPRRVERPRRGLLRPLRPFVLVVEDSAEGREMLASIADDRGLDATFVDSVEEAHEFLRGLEPERLAASVVELDADCDDALELAVELRSRFPAAGLLVSTSGGSEELAVEALRAGAHDYLHKPFDPEELQLAFTRMMAFRAVARYRPRAAGIAS
jgi:DNA-binding NtrC family response regulator